MTQVYMPIILKAPSLLLKREGFCVGASVGVILDAKVYANLGLQVVGLPNFLWSRFEPEPGQVDFDYLMSYFHVWYEAKRLGIPALVNFFGIPRWAQEDALVGDSPIRAECIGRFVEIINLVARSIGELVYVQVMNEPDNATGYEDHYGCLGDAGLYLEIMRQAYALKRDHPRLVISMGLTTYVTDFFSDFVSGGGLAFVDQLNVHFYNGWGQVNPPQFDEEIKAIRRWSQLPIWVTEANLLHDGEATPEYLAAQAAWLGRMCWIAREVGCEAYMPYALLSNWRNADILGRPAEKVLVEMARLS